MQVKFVKSHVKNDNCFDKIAMLFKSLSKHDFTQNDTFQYVLDIITGSYLVKIKVEKKESNSLNTKVIVTVYKVHLTGAHVHSDISRLKYYNIGEYLGSTIHHYEYSLSEIYYKIKDDIEYYTLIANTNKC